MRCKITENVEILKQTAEEVLVNGQSISKVPVRMYVEFIWGLYQEFEIIGMKPTINNGLPDTVLVEAEVVKGYVVDDDDEIYVEELHKNNLELKENLDYVYVFCKKLGKSRIVIANKPIVDTVYNDTKLEYRKMIAKIHNLLHDH